MCVWGGPPRQGSKGTGSMSRGAWAELETRVGSKYQIREVRIMVLTTGNRTGDSTGLVDRAWLALLQTSAREPEGFAEGSRELCLLLG